MQQKFSEKRSDRQEENEELRRKILGMGERSFRKSYYPELQEKLSDLERYKALLDQSNDAIFLINMSTGKFLNVSQSACRQIGYSEEECILMTMYDIVSDDEELLDNFFSEAADSMIFDTRIRKSSGEEAPYEINIRRVQFGGIDYGIAVARDISQRMRYEESLRLTQFALDKFSDSAVWLSTDGAIIYINENTCRQLGYAREELLSMHIWDIDPNYGPDRYAETIAELRRGVGTLKFESRYKTRDGRVFPVEVACSYIRYNNKEYVISFDRDISERKQAEEVLHRSEERYRIVADNTYDWEFWLDTDKKFIYISPSCQRITGYAASEFIADPDLYFNIIHPADQKLFRDHNNEVYNKKTTGELEFRVIRRDGGLRWIHHLCQPVFDMQGRYLGARGSNRDSTERKNAENELKEAKAQAELYLDIMGHDINNINQTAMGFLEMADNKLHEKGCLSIEDGEMIARPIENLKNSALLIDNLRKIQKEKSHAYKVKPVGINEVLLDVIRQFSQIAGRDIKIDFRPSCECEVLANPLLRDVFSNIIGNSIKHSTGSLNIDISTTVVYVYSKPFCRVSIEDNGPGISDERKARLFDFSKAVRQKIAGRGLGLYLVKTLVDDFHGKLMVEDRVPGDHTKGTRFIVLLPIINIKE